MLEEFAKLGIFMLQTIAVIMAILVVFGGMLAIATKDKDKDKARLKVKKINANYDEMKKTLQQAVMKNKDFKKAAKIKKKKTDRKNNIYILDFEGDMKASGVESLRRAITAVLTTATPKDEVVLRLESAGGTMHGYGLASMQLARLRDANIPLTVCVDKVAASGGYMMACVANKIIAAPFSIIGSIGVIAQLPNFHRVLKAKHVEWEQIMAGQYKRTLTMLGENTREGRAKFQAEIDDAHELFKEFISTMRPQTDMQKVATGEHWFARRAIELNLVDTLSTSDDYLLNASNDHALYHVSYKQKKPLMDRVLSTAQNAISNVFLAWQQRDIENRYL